MNNQEITEKLDQLEAKDKHLYLLMQIAAFQLEQHKLFAAMHDAMKKFVPALIEVDEQLQGFRDDWQDHVKNERKDFTEETKDRLRAVTRRFYGGLCPKCLSPEREIVDLDLKHTSWANFDHFYERSHNHFSNGWILCTVCHSDKTHRRKSRAEFETPFKEFQRRADENGFNPDRQTDAPKLF